MEDLTTKSYVDRLTVIITGDGISHLLGVPKIASGTGEAQATAFKTCLDEWDLISRVGALCFDTTGYKACVLIEKKLQKNLLYLACRHHVFELLIGAAFETTFGGSSAPEVKLFKPFKDQWGIIDKNKFQTATSDAAANDAMVGVP